jgi:DNA-binding beta-propeller fold protein YncE
LGAAALLTVGLVWVLVLTYQYYTTRKPIQDLPAVPAAVKVLPKAPPRYLQGFYGPSREPLAGPVSVAATQRGERVYVTEGLGQRNIVVFDRAGNAVARLAPPDTVPGGRIPAGLAIAPNGNVYATDRFRGTIDIFSPTGDYLGDFKPEDAEALPEAPLGLAFDAAGSLYVTDLKPGQHRVLVYTPEGKLRLSFGKEGDEPGQFSYPFGMTVDGQGRIYVADSNNGRVQIFDRDGRFLDLFGRGGRGEMGIPRGIAMDDVGRLLIVDLSGQTVEAWDVTADPKRLYTFGTPGVGDGQVGYPSGLALDSTGRVYVADRSNNRVQVWSY